MSIKEKLDALIEKKRTEHTSKYTPFTKISLTPTELKDIFGEDVLARFVSFRNSDYLFFNEVNQPSRYVRIYKSILRENEFTISALGQKKDKFYLEVCDEYLKVLKNQQEQFLKEAELIQSVLEHPANRLKTLFM